MSIISQEEFDKLSHKEQERRYKSFVKHIESLPPQAPVDTKYLVSLAEKYQTPIPPETIALYSKRG